MRTDGRNVEGVDVPYRFTQPMNMLVPIDEDHRYPLRSHPPRWPSWKRRCWPCARSPTREFVLQLVAKVTVHGKDLGGHRVAPVSGYISVWCANFADPARPNPNRQRPDKARRQANMKKTLFILIIAEPGPGRFVLQAHRVDRPGLGRPGRFLHPAGGLGQPGRILHRRPRSTRSTIYVRATDSKGNPIAGRTVFFEQLPNSMTHQQIEWGNFENGAGTITQGDQRQRRGQRHFLSARAKFYSAQHVHPRRAGGRRPRLSRHSLATWAPFPRTTSPSPCTIPARRGGDDQVACCRAGDVNRIGASGG